MYAELSYFEGYHFWHIAAFHEEQRLARARTHCRTAVDRRRRPR